jgi:hypothetical protein
VTVPALWDLDVRQVPLLLHVEQGDAVRVAEEQESGSGVEDLFAVRQLDLLGQLILQVLYDQLEGRETITLMNYK